MPTREIDLNIAEKLLPVLQTPKRIKVLVGGRGSTKSIGTSDIMTANMSNGAIVCGIRELMNSIEESVHSTISGSIGRMGVDGFDIQKTGIYHSSKGRSFYRGISRNPTAIRSVGRVDFAWCEEAQGLSRASLVSLIPSIRKTAGQLRDPELWFTANRGSRKDPFSEIMLAPYEKELKRNGGYYEDDMRIIIDINWRDNPWFEESGLAPQRISDKETMTPALYRHIWEGDYYDEVENSIITVEWFDAAIDAHKRLGFDPLGVEMVSHDPSDTGNDAKALTYRHGSVVKDVQESSAGDVNDGCDWALGYAIANQVDEFVWDADGMGAALKRQVADALDGKKINYQVFHGASTPEYPDAIYEPVDNKGNQKQKTNRQTFKNLRAQKYIELRDRFQKTFYAVTRDKYCDPDEMISISSEIANIDNLRSEVCRIPQKPNTNGLIQIMSKKEMQSIGIESPNMADSLMMSFVSPQEAAAEMDYEVPDAVGYY